MQGGTVSSHQKAGSRPITLRTHAHALTKHNARTASTHNILQHEFIVVYCIQLLPTEQWPRGRPRLVTCAMTGLPALVCVSVGSDTIVKKRQQRDSNTHTAIHKCMHTYVLVRAHTNTYKVHKTHTNHTQSIPTYRTQTSAREFAP